ncbi:GNAT family N-acetyltransferase [Sphingomonas parva]|uniref:GNAT family N-acetyltransferase n=1 Tax=Sphingomonas parva TaxID=2555898 RepID=A0A4Y8ZN39_9SPHN|nr:GNAT family N-acetyltransferase [Sphingomonas parva]TFI57420.1 GNAT family N-acetyltransferase [Sphingomonas parva]
MASDPPAAVAIRPAAAGDAAALGRLGAHLVAVHHGFDARRFIAPTPGTPAAYAAFLDQQRRRPEVVLLVAAEGEAVLGYAYAGVEGNDYMALRGPAGVIYDLVVDPGRRREGIGRRLLDAAIAALEALDAPRILLSTAEMNAPAQRLFGAAGFRRTMIEMTRERD